MIYLSTCIHYVQIFPLGQNRISNTNRHMESLPRPVIGQTLRINPYEWNNEDHACTKLEVYGCPLQGTHYYGYMCMITSLIMISSISP